MLPCKIHKTIQIPRKFKICTAAPKEYLFAFIRLLGYMQKKILHKAQQVTHANKGNSAYLEGVYMRKIHKRVIGLLTYISPAKQLLARAAMDVAHVISASQHLLSLSLARGCIHSEITPQILKLKTYRKLTNF